MRQVLPKLDHPCWNILFVPETSSKEAEGLVKLRVERSKGCVLPNLFLFLKAPLAIWCVEIHYQLNWSGIRYVEEFLQRVYALPLNVCDSCRCQCSRFWKRSKIWAVVPTLARQPGSQRAHSYSCVMRADNFPGTLSCCKASILIVFLETALLNLKLSSGKGGSRCLNC